MWERIATLGIKLFDMSIIIEEPNKNWHHLCRVNIRRLVGVKKKDGSVWSTRKSLESVGRVFTNNE